MAQDKRIKKERTHTALIHDFGEAKISKRLRGKVQTHVALVHDFGCAKISKCLRGKVQTHVALTHDFGEAKISKHEYMTSLHLFAFLAKVQKAYI